MTPIFQDRFGKRFGNCVSACLASIFEMPLERVPNFNIGNPIGFYKRVNAWLGRFGLRALDVVAKGWDLSVLDGVYCLANGKSPRDPERLTHAVVWLNGEIAHDPHPDGRGLVGEPETFTVFLVCDPGRNGMAAKVIGRNPNQEKRETLFYHSKNPHC